MVNRLGKISGLIFLMILPFGTIDAQISPGELSAPHSQLEGISNCTQCHVLGNKVTKEKCLTCHTEVQQRLSARKGYHSSADVSSKECTACHNEHHGKNFRLIRFDTANFDHKLTGYSLSIPHAKKKCRDCHDTKFITDQKVKSKKYTWMGVGTACLNCHADYHMNTLSSECLNCHNPDSFKPATGFSHEKAKFQLAGRHRNVECVKCHKVEIKDGKKFQEFVGVPYTSCTDCHKDPHQNRFGQKCDQCHNVESFQVVKGLNKFDHNKTHYKLEDKHLTVNCKSCHKTKFTDPLKYANCTDCHADYHKKQFEKDGVSPDCSQCHSLKGFDLFSYTIEQHNQSKFSLQGAHVAIPCNECHKKQKDWSFRDIGISCSDCHPDIHKEFIQTKFYPDENCRVCHNVNSWNDVSFDHSITGFALTGSHAKQSCRNCHIEMDSTGVIKRDSTGTIKQKFSGLTNSCSDCHADNHFGQFSKNGITTCTECHQTENWKAIKFDHNTTAFKLDGKHINVPCGKCHKPEKQGTNIYVKYKLEEFKCESCH
jgi:predicted CXXCH cytochrome family protein